MHFSVGELPLINQTVKARWPFEKVMYEVSTETVSKVISLVSLIRKSMPSCCESIHSMAASTFLDIYIQVQFQFILDGFRLSDNVEA